MSGVVLAVLVAVVGAVASGLWFGVLRRRKAEVELGVQALANLKWRDCIAVVVEALHREGYQRSVVAQAPAGGATEVLLTREGQDVLLEYKHGTAYQLTDANVREFVNNVALNGAREGVLVTLGSADASAVRVAATHNVQLIGGDALWPKVRNFVPSALLDSVRSQAAARTRKGLWGGAIASLLAAGAVYVLNREPVAPGAPGASVADAAIAPVAPPASASAPRSPADAAMLEQINATAKAMEAVARLTPEQLAQRRVEAARRVAALPRVAQAAWSAQRTLLVTLRQPADEQSDNRLLEETCRLLVQNEEMRFTRVQLETADASQRVRWRLCE